MLEKIRSFLEKRSIPYRDGEGHQGLEPTEILPLETVLRHFAVEKKVKGKTRLVAPNLIDIGGLEVEPCAFPSLSSRERFLQELSDVMGTVRVEQVLPAREIWVWSHPDYHATATVPRDTPSFSFRLVARVTERRKRVTRPMNVSPHERH